ncbi:MAG: hypothetical protein QOF82_2197 [Frankiales bacterium]|nr:hypothetical protein [Frankiales bacterium]
MTDLHDVGSTGSGEPGIWASDALLDVLGTGSSVEDDRTVALLAALVADVSADPLPALPDLARPRKRRRLAPRTGVAAGAVIAVLSTGGVAAASVNAGPTSALFPLHRVLTGQPQLDGSQRQALEVKDKLASAAKALAAGKFTRAQQDVQSAGDRLPKVAESDGQHALAAEWTALNRQVKAQVTDAPRTTAPVKPTSIPTPARTAATVSPKTLVTSSGPGGATPTPETRLTSPAPVTTPTPTVSPSPSDPGRTTSSTPTPSSTPSTQHHEPGKGGGKGGSTGPVAPGSPPAPSFAPPTSAPVTVPLVPSAMPSVPSVPASVPPVSSAAASSPAS